MGVLNVGGRGGVLFAVGVYDDRITGHKHTKLPPTLLQATHEPPRYKGTERALKNFGSSGFVQGRGGAVCVH